MRREARGAIDIGAIAQPVVEARIEGGAGLAGMPRFAQASGPIDGGLELEGGEREGCGPLARSRNTIGRGPGLRWGRRAAARIPEGGEDLERLARGVEDTARLEEQVAGMALDG